MSDDDWAMPVGDVEPLQDHMIEVYLDERGLHYYRDDEGQYLVLFAPTSHASVGVRVEIERAGAERSILTMRVRSDQIFDSERRDHADALCARWNADHRWPKVFVHDHASGGFEIIGEQHLATRGAGVHQQLVTTYCDVTAAAGFELWEWLAHELDPHHCTVTDEAIARLLDDSDGA